MKNLAIVRVCPRDQHLAVRCEESIQMHIPDCDVIWFAEKGDYTCLTLNPLFYRPYFDNFCGRSNVIPYLKTLKEIPIIGYKYVLLVDSDVTFIQNPLQENFDLGGIQDFNNKRHFSGQCIILKSELLQSVLEYEDVFQLTELLIDKNISIADDTVISWIATEFTTNTKDFFNQDYWLHSKEI